MKKAIWLVCAVFISTNMFSAGYGIYSPLLDQYLEGYDINVFIEYPKKELCMIWDGAEWVIDSQTEYQYKRNENGKVEYMEYTDTKTESTYSFEYSYDKDKVKQVQKRVIEKNKKVTESVLSVTYGEKEVAEELTTDNAFVYSRVYRMDSFGRVVSIESNSINAFTRKPQRDFLWELAYVDDTDKIREIRRIGIKNKGMPTVYFKYDGNWCTIETTDSVKRIQSVDGLLKSVLVKYAAGQFVSSQTDVLYDRFRRIKEIMLRHSNSLTDFERNVVQGRRYVYEY